MEVLTLEQAGIFAWSNSKKNKSLFVRNNFLFFRLTNLMLGNRVNL